ncbi:carboxymuconolactone decarboxylase family protein [Cupriavidus basilensis]
MRPAVRGRAGRGDRDDIAARQPPGQRAQYRTIDSPGQAQPSATGFEHSLADLVRLRVSQVNGCPYCIDLHSARRAGRRDGGTDRYAGSLA